MQWNCQWQQGCSWKTSHLIFQASKQQAKSPTISCINSHFVTFSHQHHWIYFQTGITKTYFTPKDQMSFMVGSTSGNEKVPGLDQDLTLMYTAGSTTEWQAANTLLVLDRRAHQCWANFSEWEKKNSAHSHLNHTTMWINILIRYHTDLDCPEVFKWCWKEIVGINMVMSIIGWVNCHLPERKVSSFQVVTLLLWLDLQNIR